MELAACCVGRGPAAGEIAGLAALNAIAGWVADVPADLLARLYGAVARRAVEDDAVAGRDQC